MLSKERVDAQTSTGRRSRILHATSQSEAAELINLKEPRTRLDVGEQLHVQEIVHSLEAILEALNRIDDVAENDRGREGIQSVSLCETA